MGNYTSGRRISDTLEGSGFARQRSSLAGKAVGGKPSRCRFNNRGYGDVCAGGGAIFCQGGTLTISKCNISDNIVVGEVILFGTGGGIYCYQCNSLSITGSIISGNLANPKESRGGGIFIGPRLYSRLYPLCNVTIKDCIINENSAWQGGGIASYNCSNLKITGCTFSRNSGRGGGLYDWDSNSTLVNCIFTGNSSSGVSAYNYNGSMTLTGCTFVENSSYTNGGGILATGNLTINNCIMAGNSANCGGGIYSYYSSSNITNCTFAENYAANGNALACDSNKHQYPSNLRLTNCILWNGRNEIFNNDGSTIDITYSNVQNGWPGTGNIHTGPCFV
jgi:predicted outer membrane repeat protein